MRKRRIAVHELQYADGSIKPAFIELSDGKVSAYGHLDEELPMTEWLGGIVRLHVDRKGDLRVYWNGKML